MLKNDLKGKARRECWKIASEKSGSAGENQKSSPINTKERHGKGNAPRGIRSHKKKKQP